MYSIFLKEPARDDLRKLDKVLQKRLGSSLKKFQENPFYYAKKLTEPRRTGDYRFRVGDYRLFFDVRGEEIIILRISHRREAYNK